MSCGSYYDTDAPNNETNYCSEPYVKNGPSMKPFRGINSFDPKAKRRAEIRKILCEVCATIKSKFSSYGGPDDIGNDEARKKIDELSQTLFMAIDNNKFDNAPASDIEYVTSFTKKLYAIAKTEKDTIQSETNDLIGSMVQQQADQSQRYANLAGRLGSLREPLQAGKRPRKYK
jgi:hypothetical protein